MNRENAPKLVLQIASFFVGVCGLVDFSMILNLISQQGGCTKEVEINIGSPGCKYNLAQAVIFEIAFALALVVPLFGSGVSSGFLHFVAIAADLASIIVAVVYIIAYRVDDNWSIQSSDVAKFTFGNEIFLLGMGAILTLFHISLYKMLKKGGRDFILDWVIFKRFR